LTLVNDLSHKSTKQTRRERCGDGGYDCGAGLKHGDLMSDADAMAALLKVSLALAPTPPIPLTCRCFVRQSTLMASMATR